MNFYKQVVLTTDVKADRAALELNISQAVTINYKPRTDRNLTFCNLLPFHLIATRSIFQILIAVLSTRVTIHIFNQLTNNSTRNGSKSFIYLSIDALGPILFASSTGYIHGLHRQYRRVSHLLRSLFLTPVAAIHGLEPLKDNLHARRID